MSSIPSLDHWVYTVLPDGHRICVDRKYTGEIRLEIGHASKVDEFVIRRREITAEGGLQTMPTTQYAAESALANFLVVNNLLYYSMTIDGMTIPINVTSIEVTAADAPLVYIGTVTYQFDQEKPHYLTEPIRWSHSMTGGTSTASVPIFQWYYGGNTQYTGVNYNKETRSYDGADIYSPQWRMTCKQQLLKAVAGTSYLLQLQHMSKTVNGSVWKGFPVRSVLYLGADLEEAEYYNNPVWNITHQFIVEPPMENFTIGTIPVAFKGGHDYLWTADIVTEDASHNTVPVVQQVNVAQMYMMMDFSQLGLGT